MVNNSKIKSLFKHAEAVAFGKGGTRVHCTCPSLGGIQSIIPSKKNNLKNEQFHKSFFLEMHNNIFHLFMLCFFGCKRQIVFAGRLKFLYVYTPFPKKTFRKFLCADPGCVLRDKPFYLS